MKITYIHHSSFLVELKDTMLLFDYYQGKLPQLPGGKMLYVFASHFHGDHYSPVIFKLAEERENIFYVLSKDIRKKDIPEELLSKVRFVKPGERLELDGKTDHAGTGGSLKIETFKSTDEGVAFWVRCEERDIYHAGDLNNWWWEGEDKAWNRNMAADFGREMDKMAGRHADVAFVPLDPRQEQWFYLGMDQFLRNVQADHVFPMHFWKDYGIIEKMKQLPGSADYRDRIVDIHREGEEFEL